MRTARPTKAKTSQPAPPVVKSGSRQRAAQASETARGSSRKRAAEASEPARGSSRKRAAEDAEPAKKPAAVTRMTRSRAAAVKPAVPVAVPKKTTRVSQPEPLISHRDHPVSVRDMRLLLSSKRQPG